jgi:N-acetylmuramoyl-L-alanine amidase
MSIICLDAGHGGEPGAVNGSKHESVATLDIAFKVGAELERKGHEVVYTRTTDKHITLAERCTISNNKGVNAFISIHLNASTNRNAHGIETWCYYKVGKTTKELANNIQNALIKSTNATNRGVKTTETLYVLKHTIAPAVLVECGFISNNDESELLFDDDYQNKIANAIVTGIENTLKNKDNLNG